MIACFLDEFLMEINLWVKYGLKFPLSPPRYIRPFIIKGNQFEKIMPIAIRSVLFILGLLLLLDSLILFTQLKFNVGTLVPFAIGLMFLLHAIYWQAITDFRYYPLQVSWIRSSSVLAKINFNALWQIGWGVFLLWLLSLIAFMGYLRSHINDSNRPLQRPVAAIMVLGSGVKNGKPSATLAKRLDTASVLAEKQPTALVLVSGGVDIGETQSEASVMANYLLTSHHLAPTRLALEQESSSTEANLANSKAILVEHSLSERSPVAIVTSDFHILRAKAIAKKQGYRDVQMVASPTPLAIRYNAWVREYFAFVSGWILREY